MPFLQKAAKGAVHKLEKNIKRDLYSAANIAEAEKKEFYLGFIWVH